MIKPEKEFIDVIGDVTLGKPCYIILPTGALARTSPVVNFFYFHTGKWKIETANTIYRN